MQRTSRRGDGRFINTLSAMYTRSARVLFWTPSRASVGCSDTHGRVMRRSHSAQPQRQPARVMRCDSCAPLIINQTCHRCRDLACHIRQFLWSELHCSADA